MVTVFATSFVPKCFSTFSCTCKKFILCVERWYAKRFLHPDIVATYDYIFIWDEDLGLENFDAEE